MYSEFNSVYGFLINMLTTVYILPMRHIILINPLLTGDQLSMTPTPFNLVYGHRRASWFTVIAARRVLWTGISL
jgi:hypothetical protein